MQLNSPPLEPVTEQQWNQVLEAFDRAGASAILRLETAEVIFAMPHEITICTDCTALFSAGAHLYLLDIRGATIQPAEDATS